MSSKFLPIFPLKLVVFPNEKLNLHVFEPRYRQLANECHSEGTTFGIPSFINNRLMTYGTELKLLKIAKTYPNGSMDIKCKGKAVFKVDHVYNQVPDKLYAGADVTLIEQDYDKDLLTAMNILQLMRELYRYMNINKSVPTDPNDLWTYDIAHHVGFNVKQEYEFLKLETEKLRQEVILEHLENFIPVVKEMEEMRRKAKMNGHFKNLIPPKF